MKKHRVLCLILAIVLITALPVLGRGNQEKSSDVLVVYAYDSFTGDWGAGPEVIKAFEEETGIQVQLVSAGSGGELLQRLKLEERSPRADVIVGLNDYTLHEALDSGLFESYASSALQDIPSFIKFDETNTLLPFNYGNFAFIADTEKLSTTPLSLEDLVSPDYRNKIILIDPRTSSVGLGLLLWTISVYGEQYLSWWEAVKPNVLTIAESWSSAYGLFTEGEAPLVISYTTSPVYHVLYENSTRFQTLLFEEGHAMTIEGVAILKSSQQKDKAKQFVDYLLTKAQETVAVANTMYPANSTTTLPAAFEYAPKPHMSLSIDDRTIEENLERWLSEWTTIMSR